MTLEQAGIIIGIVMSFVSLCSTLFVLVARIAKIEVKVETLWDFQLRRAAGETVMRGLGTLNSPLEMSQYSLQCFDSLRDDLRKWYETRKQKSDRELAFEIEKDFGARIVSEVCIPMGLQHGACLLIALAVAKDSTSIDMPVDDPHLHQSPPDGQ